MNLHLSSFLVWLGLLAAAFAATEYRVPLADGFDYPVGKPDAYGYYKERGFRSSGHAGEDWNGRGGGNSDLGDPVYCTAHGIVVYSKNYGGSWGNLIIVRHAYRHIEDGSVYFIDSVYAHLHERNVELYDRVRRGQKVGTIGTASGLYWAHLHFEIRKNINIGSNQRKYPIDKANYFDPTEFIDDHRSLRLEYGSMRIPVDTFDTGASNLFRGKSIGEIPPHPKPTPEAREKLTADLREMLERHALDRGSRGKPYVPSSPAAADTPEAKRERDEIRDFWKRHREQLPEKAPEPETSVIETE